MTDPDPMITLAAIFKTDHFTVEAPLKTRGKPKVDIRTQGPEFVVRFSLRKVVAGQIFLGLYPSAANLPNADKLRIGDYALLGNGEVIQIRK